MRWLSIRIEEFANVERIFAAVELQNDLQNYLQNSLQNNLQFELRPFCLLQKTV